MFEPAPVLTEFLYAGRPYPNVTALLDLAETVLVKTPRFSESQLVEIVNAHPRLGANKLTVLSEASKREQGKGSEDEDVNRKLADINDKYEAKFKFKLVEFVNGRSRSEMVPVLQKRLEEGTRIQELKKGLQAMVDIARDRIAKKMSCV
ncbi:Oxo-4-hydroxy-4-carboxy-5-ureidoimidazoline decarboxylase [Obelidium mucronatum]|nr:Oxo-4-hydroxy-4-carboxy-5-ureidoimidazoline decarboxylase [Obelidium mucronatum]